jgi:hypothetical protein
MPPLVALAGGSSVVRECAAVRRCGAWNFPTCKPPIGTTGGESSVVVASMRAVVRGGLDQRWLAGAGSGRKRSILMNCSGACGWSVLEWLPPDRLYGIQLYLGCRPNVPQPDVESWATRAPRHAGELL